MARNAPDPTVYVKVRKVELSEHQDEHGRYGSITYDPGGIRQEITLPITNPNKTDRLELPFYEGRDTDIVDVKRLAGGR